MTSLTIRNLTINPLELVYIERFEGERAAHLFSNVTSAITGCFNGGSDSPPHEASSASEALHRHDVNVSIDPFHTRQTELRTADAGKELVRLRFRAAGHDYETDMPSLSSRSATMRNLTDGPSGLTAVYVPDGALLAVFSSAHLNAWMKELSDEWPLPLLSIPGTHNSPTCHKALPSVRCQAVGVGEQLRNGIRFLDIRLSCEPDDDKLTLVHSAFPISLTGAKYFSDMLQVVYDFLEHNPSETVLMSLKREGTGKGTDQDLGKYLKHSYVDKKRDRWWTEPKIPTLGAARGRIVVIRRFNLDDGMRRECWGGRGWGVDASSWPDNCEDGRCDGDQIRVQDFYEVSESTNIQKKIDFARGALERASEQAFFPAGTPRYSAGERMPPLFVNFLSASNFFNASCWPEKIAAKVNPSIVQYLCTRHGVDDMGPKKLKIGAASTGIVVTDWVGLDDDWDLTRCIVGMNARLQQLKTERTIKSKITNQT